MNKLIAFLLIALLLPSIATAELVINKYTNDFVASSPNNEQLKICSCETKVDRIIVENIGTFYGDFHVSVEGTYPAGMRIVKSDFQLAPKHFQEVLIYVENSCGLSGVYDYDVVVTNSYGRTQRIDRTIRVDQCESARLEVSPDNRTVGLCQPATFNVNVTNIGTFADTFSLGFGQYQPTAAATDLYLQPGESYIQDVTYQFACSEFGTFNVPFILNTNRNGPGITTWREIDVINQYNFGLNVSSRIDVCAQTTTQVPITLENVANVPDDVTIRLDAPRFVTLEQSAHLEPLESKNLSMTIAAQTPGTHTLRLTASDRFGVSREREIELQVNNCYDPAIDVRSAPEVVITEPDTACCGERIYYVNVQNNGDRSQTFQLKIDGPSIFTLEETTVRLEPNQNMNVRITAELPCIDEQVSATITVSPLGQPQLTRSATLVVNSQTLRTCHMVQIDDDELRVPETATVVPVIVKHTGIEGGEYSITTNSTIFTIEESSIYLQPGEQRAIHMIPITNLSETEKGRYIVLPTFTYNDPTIEYIESVGVELQGKGFLQRFTEWLVGILRSFTLCLIVILLLVLLIIAAIIMLILIYAGKPILREGARPSRLFWWKALIGAGILLLLILLLFLRAPGVEMTYERVANNEATTIEMYQNTEYSVDVAQYFTDPDMDILSYSVTQPRDISATIEGSILTLVPDRNFAGENTMIITASDNKGGVADSPVFIIRVIPRREYTLLQWLNLWCHHIVAVMLIVLLLIMLLIVFTVPEYRPKPYSGNTLVIVSKTARKTRKAVVRKAKSARTARKTVAKRKATPNGSAKRKAKRKPNKARSAKRTARKASTRTAAKRKATARNAAKRRTVKPIPRSRALVPIGTARGKQVAPARGRQVVRPKNETLIRDFREGQTVNIAVGAHPPAPMVAVPGMAQSEVIYVGSKEGNTVHTPYCINARRIPKNKRVAFSSKREAVSVGLVPCKMCRPFEGSM